MCLLTDLSLGVSSLSLGHRPTEPRPQGEPATPGPGPAAAVPGPALASRPATKPVIVGLDLTGKLLLWDARLPPHPDAVVFAGVVLGRELATLADFSSPQG